MPELTIDEILTRADQLITAENLDDSRIDAGAQQGISRLNEGASPDRVCALALLSGVKSEVGGLNGIVGDDSADASELADQLQVDVAALIPDGDDAALITPPENAPTVVFRSELRDDPARLDSALAGIIMSSRETLSNQVNIGAAGDPTRPWLCTWVCGLCAAALLDGVPFDEIPVCLACLTCVSGSG